MSLPIALLAATLSAAARAPMAAAFRYRQMSLPDMILDTWYFSKEEGARTERPSVGARTYGLEFRLEPAANVYTFYAEYWSARWEEGYWDDREEPADHNDGDWVRPENLGLVAAGVRFGHEIALSPEENDVYAGLLLGAGLGIGFPTGRVKRWKAGPAVIDDPDRCLPGAPAWERKDECEPDDDLELWPVAPVVDIGAEVRLHVYEYGVIGLDLGFHDMFYWGLSAGGAF